MKDLDALRTIGEVSKILNIPVYVVRFWEKKFSLINPIKKARGTRYYDNKQMKILKRIKFLLYEEKFSISGAQKNLVNEKNDKNLTDKNELNKFATIIDKENGTKHKNLKELRNTLRKARKIYSKRARI